MKRWIVLARDSLQEYLTLGQEALEALTAGDKVALSRILLRRTLVFQRYCRIESLAAASGYDVSKHASMIDLWMQIDSTNVLFNDEYQSGELLAS